jgi:5-methylcytosine-specific restriction protein A
MATFLLTWNPRHWTWTEFEAEYLNARNDGFLDSRWSCGVTRKIKEGDRVFLLRQGVAPKGILAAGVAASEPFEDAHYSEAGRTARYVAVRFDVLLRPESEILPRAALDHGKLRDVHWNTQASGMSIPPDAAAELEEVWSAHLEALGLKTYRSADEVATKEKFWEGALRRVTVNAYERDPRARAACIAHYGSRCAICDIDFGDVFGDVARGFIHVHHLRQLSDIRKGYIVDPVADLRPVCPNCHSVIHRRSPPFTIDEVKNLRKPSG